MTPQEFVQDVENQTELAVREFNADNDLTIQQDNDDGRYISPTLIDGSGNEISATCWSDKDGTFYPAFPK